MYIFLYVCAANYRCSERPEVGVGSLVVSYLMWVLRSTCSAAEPALSPSMFQLFTDIRL